MLTEPPPSPDHERPRAYPLGRAGRLAFTALFWPYLITSSAILFVPALGLFCWSLLFDRDRKLLRRFTEEWAAHYLERAPFARVEVLGRERVRLDRSYVFVANHQSMVDVLAVYAARLPALWVSKVENFYAPFIGWNMGLNGYIPVKRGYLPSIMRMIRTCLARLEEGRSLFIFPEGTRSGDGAVGSFHRGAFLLAARARVPVVPLCMVGTRDVLRKGSALVCPGRVTLSILDPVDPSEHGFDSRRLRDHVRSLMEAEVSRLRQADEGRARP